MNVETTPIKPIADADWQARVDLAAVYRLLAHHGWGDVIFNHAAMRCPSNPRHFLIKRHELLYTEVTASNLVEVSMDDDLDERSGVNRPGFTLHSGVLRGRPGRDLLGPRPPGGRHRALRPRARPAPAVAECDALL